MSRPNAPEITDPYRTWIAVIGMGAAGGSFFSSLVDRIEFTGMANQIGILLIEDAPDDVLFQKRVAIGMALHEDYLLYQMKCEKLGIPVRVIDESSIVEIDKIGRRFNVEVEGGSGYFADYVVLALGSHPKQSLPHLRDHPGYIYNPWDWKRYEQVSPETPVAVIGLGPTAVDAIVLLDDLGVKQIYALSRSGRLQYVRPKGKPLPLVGLDRTRLENMFKLHKERGLEPLSFNWLEMLLATEFYGHEGSCTEWVEDVRASKLAPRDALLEGLKKSDKNSSWYGIQEHRPNHATSLGCNE